VAGLFASGRIVDIILLLMLLEGIALLAYHYKTKRGLTPVAVLSNLLAGGFLLLALRAAMTAASWEWIALWLLLALGGHLLDLFMRWRG
jgi:hypothetical protein